MDTDVENELEGSFRFKTPEEYLRELERLIGSQVSSRKKKDRRDAKLEQAYEDLLEEYIKFCSDDDK